MHCTRKKFFKIKNEGCRDGWRQHCTFGIAHCAMPHSIQVDDVIVILSLAVGWVAAATLQGSR